MKFNEYLYLKKIKINEFSRKTKISRDAIIRYKQGAKPAPKQAWIIFIETEGVVTFQDMGYSKPPRNPLKDL